MKQTMTQIKGLENYFWPKFALISFKFACQDTNFGLSFASNSSDPSLKVRGRDDDEFWPQFCVQQPGSLTESSRPLWRRISASVFLPTAQIHHWKFAAEMTTNFGLSFASNSPDPSLKVRGRDDEEFRPLFCVQQPGFIIKSSRPQWRRTSASVLRPTARIHHWKFSASKDKFWP